MAERLTECIDSHLLDNGEMVKEYSLNSKIKLNHFSCMDIPNAVYDKLGKLEDILEKYDLKVEELDERIYNGAMNYVDKLKAEADRDTWQKACELACKWFKQTGFIGDQTEVDYFYQQAKTEGNDE